VFREIKERTKKFKEDIDSKGFLGKKQVVTRHPQNAPTRAMRFKDSGDSGAGWRSVRLVRIQGWGTQEVDSRRWYKPLWGTAH
jgi:hypothetical protein